jgi:hypothetical protein
MYKLPLENLKHLLITHSHQDHWLPSELYYRRPGFSHVPEDAVLHIYGNERVIKSLEEAMHGNLDQYVFPPDDPAYEKIPACIPTRNRRFAVSCYSWPGITPRKCMEIYGIQIAPLLRTILSAGGVQQINPQGTYFHRALSRAMLSRWEH